MVAAAQSRSAGSLAPNRFEKGLAVGAAVLLVFVLAAIARGHEHWSKASGLIWAHLATIIIALVLTPVMLLRRRGDQLHRWLGLIWVLSLSTTAALSFGIRTINPGGFSPIHVLSAFTLTQTPLIVWYAHRHQIVAHRITVCLMVCGALLIAGVFTFPFDRLLGRWLFG